MTTPGKIYQQIPKIMADVGPIAKNRKSTASGGYSFRGIDDVYEALQLIMAKHGVFPVPEVLSERTEERTSKGGGLLIYRVLTIKYYLYADDGSYVAPIVIGEGMDSGDKAANKAMSVAEKYAMLQVFMIPTHEAKDPENDSPDPDPKKDNKMFGQKETLSDTPHRDKLDQIDQDSINRAAQAAAKKVLDAGLPKPKTGYDPHDRKQQDWLIAKLKAKNIPDDRWDVIGNALAGRPLTDFGAVLDLLNV